jgi:dTDP-4-amino-4,6-dideoxygalactose transaminase
MMFPLRVRGGGEVRQALVNFLEESGIETRDLFPLLTQPIYRALFGDLTPDYPVASELAVSGFYVGCHPALSPSDLAYVIERLHAFAWPSRHGG